jgi:hypothetical protein
MQRRDGIHCLTCTLEVGEIGRGTSLGATPVAKVMASNSFKDSTVAFSFNRNSTSRDPSKQRIRERQSQERERDTESGERERERETEREMRREATHCASQFVSESISKFHRTLASQESAVCGSQEQQQEVSTREKRCQGHYLCHVELPSDARVLFEESHLVTSLSCGDSTS